jgi:diguanylate cyclase (GGDEF)-like protein
VQVDGDAVGALVVAAPTTGRPADEDMETLGVLAGQLAAYLTGVRLLIAERAERRRTQVLLEVAQAVTQSSDLETALVGIARAAATFSVAHRCSIFLMDAAGRPRPAIGWDAIDKGTSQERIGELWAFSRRLERTGLSPPVSELTALLQGPPLVVEDGRDAPAVIRQWLEAFEVKSAAIYPLITLRGSVGVMNLTAHDQPVHFPSDEVEAMRAIALQAAAVIEHLRLLEQVRDQAVRDGLTGLYNHRHMKEALDAEIRVMHETGRPLSVALLDIDGFKRLNDQHGHAAGDAALQRVASVLRGTFRESDMIARYGGDEFLVMMPGVDAEVAMARAAELLAALAADETTARASIGIAVAPDDAVTASALLDAADSAMYAAKRRGDGIALAGRER